MSKCAPVTVDLECGTVDVIADASAVVEVEASAVEVPELAATAVELIEAATEIELSASGPRGPRGAQGAPGVGSIGYIDGQAPLAGEISALRCVAVDNGIFRYPDTGDKADAPRVVGIAINAAVNGDPVRAQVSGPLTDNSWNWSPGLVYCGANGALTQSLTGLRFVQPVARVVSPSSIFVSLLLPVVRA